MCFCKTTDLAGQTFYHRSSHANGVEVLELAVGQINGGFCVPEFADGF